MRKTTKTLLMMTVASVVLLQACDMTETRTGGQTGTKTDGTGKQIAGNKGGETGKRTDDGTLRDRMGQKTDAERKERDKLARIIGGKVAKEEAEKRPVTGSATGAGQAGNAPPPGVQPRYSTAKVKPMEPPKDIRRAGEPTDREKYGKIKENPVKRVAEAPVSTFSIDVDTGSYSNVRRFLTQGRMPPRDAVRVEEMINYFSYDYKVPETKDKPFAVHTEVAKTPWNKDTYLLKIGIKGFDIERAERPPANLVFLVDVSGSMGAANKLPLVIKSLKLLTDQLTEKDRISLVVYAGAAGVVLEPTPGDQKFKIKAALDRLRSGGSTAGGAGLKLAYAMARQAKIDGGINRVLIATDGDFNVGQVGTEALKDMIKREREAGVSLTTMGFGMYNYNGELMEQLADVGNGNYAYIDTLAEARKVLVDEMSSTLFTIAKDVKIQVEFNPGVVAEYRLVGYENRILRREDFSNDKVDAGEIGAGHTVTAIYELALKGGNGTRLEGLRYGKTAEEKTAGSTEEFAFLRLRYKAPGGKVSKLIETPLKTAALKEAPEQASTDLRFASAVAAFGQVLRGGKYTGSFSYDEIIAQANGAKGKDSFGYRAAFVQLVRQAKSLDTGG